MGNFYIKSDELYHHGILGMKWGIRRYQPYSVNPRKSGKGGKEIGEARASRDVQRTLNKITRLDKKAQKLNKKAAKKQIKASRKQKKASKALATATSNSKMKDAFKLQMKANKQQIKASKYQLKASKKTKKAMNAVAKINKKYENVKLGELSQEQIAVGRKYALKFIEQPKKANTKSNSKKSNTKSNSQKSGNKYSPEKIKKEISKAKSSDQWNLEFLEAIQNSTILYNHDKQAMLKEYEKYLKDPNDYWKNGRYKLEEM